MFQISRRCAVFLLDVSTSSGTFFFYSSTFKKNFACYKRRKITHSFYQSASKTSSSAGSDRRQPRVRTKNCVAASRGLRRSARSSCGATRQQICSSGCVDRSYRRDRVGANIRQAAMQSGRLARKNANEPNADARWRGSFLESERRFHVKRQCSSYRQTTVFYYNSEAVRRQRRRSNTNHSTNASHSKNRGATRQAESLASCSASKNQSSGDRWESNDEGTSLNVRLTTGDERRPNISACSRLSESYSASVVSCSLDSTNVPQRSSSNDNDDNLADRARRRGECRPTAATRRFQPPPATRRSLPLFLAAPSNSQPIDRSVGDLFNLSKSVIIEINRDLGEFVDTKQSPIGLFMNCASVLMSEHFADNEAGAAEICAPKGADALIDRTLHPKATGGVGNTQTGSIVSPNASPAGTPSITA